VRLISWNVQRRVRDGLRRQVEAVASRAPDLVALQEVTATTGPLLKDQLPELGLAHVAASLDLVAEARADRRRERSGVLLASRWPFRLIPPTEPDLPWPERVLSAVVSSPWGPLEVHAAYIPNVATGPAVGRPWLKAETFEAIFARLAGRSPRPRILCGDFNVPLAEEPDGTIVPFGRPGRQADAELAILRDLGRFDLGDVYRALHGYSVQEFSWYGQVRGYRLDHIFASRSLNPAECRYLHEFRQARLSDHSPVEALFIPSNGVSFSPRGHARAPGSPAGPAQAGAGAWLPCPR
jgi:exonuclease III